MRVTGRHFVSVITIKKLDYRINIKSISFKVDPPGGWKISVTFAQTTAGPNRVNFRRIKKGGLFFEFEKRTQIQ
jgi:hypothetical protein